MMYKNCKLCQLEDDIDYLHPIYDGKSNNYVLICENCRDKIFKDRERLSEKERCDICEGTLLEYEKLNGICDNCDYKKSLCDSPNTTTKGSDPNRND